MPQSQQNALGLTRSVTNTLRAQLPAVAAQTVAAIVSEVPGYAGALDGPMGEQIEGAVEMALGGFLKLAARAHDSDPGSPLRPALDAAYSLGRGEARNGRSMDALLAAYRVGARVAWRELSGVAVTGRAPAATMAQFAELVFAYIDELSAASVAGHADQLATADRAQQRYLERFTRSLLAGDSTEVLSAAAARAGWSAPDTLTAVLLPGPVRDLRALAGSGTLVLADDLPRFGAADDNVALLVPDVDTAGRRRLRRSLSGRRALIGPTRPWLQAARSYERVVRAHALGITAPDVVDTDEHLTELVLHSDAEALADLRAQVLAPMVGLRASSADK
ncbi:MAG: PucR family transcriptional regulator, partial [Actinomycetota bacterium]|nr:PucR family transcriptional regulator [Actinomycetota bacterium]